MTPDPASKAELESLDTSHMLIIYLNWMSRLIHPHRRRAHLSAEIRQNPIFARDEEDVRRLLAKLAAGMDVTPHLSRGVLVGFESKRGGRRKTQAIDELLNHWGVHHLHYRHQLDGDGFMRRSREHRHLLFAIVKVGDVYALDIFRHGDWTKQRMIEIATRNWPDANLFLSINAVSASPLTDEQVANLRANNTNAALSVDGKVYMSATGGVSGAGTSTLSSITAMRILRLLDAYDGDEQKLIQALAADPLNPPIRRPPRPRYEVVVAGMPATYGLAIREKHSGAALWLG
jgi:hypothetical protein